VRACPLPQEWSPFKGGESEKSGLREKRKSLKKKHWAEGTTISGGKEESRDFGKGIGIARFIGWFLFGGPSDQRKCELGMYSKTGSSH